MQITEARRGFRVHRSLLDKRSLAAHSGDTLSLVVSGETTIMHYANSSS
jgi:hypothetical protein